MISVDVEAYGSLRLTETSRPVLRGEQQLHLRKFVKASKSKSRTRKSSSQYGKAADNKLWEALRERRTELAKEQGVPAYVIFHDATLMEMVERQPETLVQMANISGIGERKLEAYGEDFLAVINEHTKENDAPITDTVDDTLQLFRVGMDAAAIARQRDLTPTTVYSHLAKAIQNGDAELHDVTGMDEVTINTIRNAIEQYEEEGKLKPVFEALDGEYDYNILRCIKAAMVCEAG